MSKANNITYNNISSTERAILSELGVEPGSHFRSIVNTLRQFLKIGYTDIEALLATSHCTSYINRLVDLTPKADKKQRRDQLNLAAKMHEKELTALHTRYYAQYTAKQIAIEKEKERRILHARRLQNFKNGGTRLERYSAFGIIRVRAITSVETPLSRHVQYVTTRRQFEIQLKKNKEQLAIREALIESGKHLTSRTFVPDNELPDDEAPLPVVVARYIPGGRAMEFRKHAQRCVGMKPMQIIKSFPGNTYREPEQPPTPSADIMTGLLEQLPQAQRLVLMDTSQPEKRRGSKTIVETRPDQSAFSAAVRHNCFDCCVISGVSVRYRTEAAHLIEHKQGGIDHYSNGILLRIDLHRLFDERLIAFHPVALTTHIADWVLAADHDLLPYQGKLLPPFRKPINSESLLPRWEIFQHLNKNPA